MTNPQNQTQKKAPEILARGSFKPQDIEILEAESNREIDPKLEAQIDPLWTRIKRVAEIRGKNCYNGICYRLNDLRTESRERERLYNSQSQPLISKLSQA